MAEVTDKEWLEYKQKFNKSYDNDDEDKKRRQIYASSKFRIEEHNKKFANGEVTYSMGINHMADSTEEEMMARQGKRAPPPKPPTAV